MKSLTTLTNLATNLSNNTSSSNQSLMKELIGDGHRQLIQKWFDNERTATITTVGGFTLTVTSAAAIGATSATLSAVWPYPSCTQLVTFSDGSQVTGTFTYNATTLTWTNGLVGTRFNLTASVAAGATTAVLSSAWAYSTASKVAQFSDGEQKTVTFTANSTAISWAGGLSATVQSYLNTSISTTSIATVGVQDYAIPANISKIKNNTINVGQLRYQPTFVMTRQEWDLINFLPYTSDIPNYVFPYNNKLGIFPIPSTTGNIITFNYKTRVADLSYADYSTGTVGGTVGSTAITGTSTTWNSVGTYPLNTDLTFANLFIRINPPKGDGIWYQIQSFTSDTALTLVNPIVNAPSMASGASYTIGQFPLLQEDFHDMLVYYSLKTYFSTIVQDDRKFKEYDTLYRERLELLKDYAGTKSVNVDLEAEPQMVNPNLFYYGTG